MKTKVVSVLICLVLLLTFAPLPVMRSIQAQRLTPDDSLVEVAMTQMEGNEPGTPVVTGELGLSASVQVFPYDVDIYGIYLVEGDNVSLVTSVPVDHINADRVTAKLSPDGFKVAYLVEYGNTGFSRLVVVGVDGLNSNPLWENNDPGRYITSFSWSHDSERLAYALSRDPFGAAPDLAAAFEDPDAEVDPAAATNPFADVLELTGEVWVTDLYGTQQEQIVDQGAMAVLGWAEDDVGILFTRYITEAEESLLLAASEQNTTRNIFPPSWIPAGVSVVSRTATMTTSVVSALVTNILPVSGTLEAPLYLDFYLLEAVDGTQQLAALSVGNNYHELATTSGGPVTLSLASLTGNNMQSLNGNLAFSPVLTNSASMQEISLSPDGARLAYLTEDYGALWVADIDGANHTSVVTSGLKMGIIWGQESTTVGVAALEQYTTEVFALNGDLLGSLSALPSADMLAEPLNARVAKQLNVPYMHQLWDTPDHFNGHWACMPTSAAMVLAYYNKLTPNPITVSKPTPHTSNYGFYVSERHGIYTTGYRDPSGRTAYGFYGYLRFDWLNARQLMYNYGMDFPNRTMSSGKVTGGGDWEPGVDKIKAAIDRGHPVMLSSTLTRDGHVILIVGYTTDNRLIVHDPYGNYYSKPYNGGQYGNGFYWYRFVDLWPYPYRHRFMMEVIGTPPAGGGGCGGGTPTITHWKGEYFNNVNLSGQPSLVRNDTTMDFNWGTSSPAPGCINADNFSVRWTRTIYFQRGIYRFRTTTDDGVRLYVNNQLVINQWRDQATTVHESGDVFLPAGSATVRMEYYERGGAAVAKLDSRLIGTGSSGSGWRGEYFNNRTLSGNPTFVRNDDSIYFNWGSGGPGGGVSSDNFSVRWTRTVNVPRTGYYQFYARADDGVRVWVNNQLSINGWRDQAATTYGSDWIYLNQGNNSLKVEYYERTGDAYIRFWMVPAFYGQFYSNRNLSGSPSYIRYYTDVNFNWGWLGPPLTTRDDFSARFTGQAALSGGRYKFCVRADDGVRLYINNHLVINRWQNQPATTYCVDLDLARGFHEIKMEYYERDGVAVAQLWWNKYSGSDALSAATVTLDEPTEEFDIWALYGDSGYLGPLIEADITSLTIAPGETVFLPLVLRQP